MIQRWEKMTQETQVTIPLTPSLARLRGQPLPFSSLGWDSKENIPFSRGKKTGNRKKGDH